MTFPDAKKHEKELQHLDDMLALYTSFSSPTLIQGDQQKEEFTQQTKDFLNEKEKGTVTLEREIVSPANLDNRHGGKVVPKEVLSSSDGKQVRDANLRQHDLSQLEFKERSRGQFAYL